jgi:hypothetical protein
MKMNKSQGKNQVSTKREITVEDILKGVRYKGLKELAGVIITHLDGGRFTRKQCIKCLGNEEGPDIVEHDKWVEYMESVIDRFVRSISHDIILVRKKGREKNHICDGCHELF